MKGMIIYLCLVPLALLVLTQIVAFVGMPGEAIAYGLAVGEYIAPRIVYAVGGAGAIVCLLLAVMLRRFHNDDGVAGRIRAKTGTLIEANSLSGFIMTEKGRVLTFSILVDHIEVGTTTNMRSVIDNFLVSLIKL